MAACPGSFATSQSTTSPFEVGCAWTIVLKLVRVKIRHSLSVFPPPPLARPNIWRLVKSTERLTCFLLPESRNIRKVKDYGAGGTSPSDRDHNYCSRLSRPLFSAIPQDSFTQWLLPISISLHHRLSSIIDRCCIDLTSAELDALLHHGAQIRGKQTWTIIARRKAFSGREGSSNQAY